MGCFAWANPSAAPDEESAAAMSQTRMRRRHILQFVEHIERNSKPRQFKLEKEIVHRAYAQQTKLPSPRYDVFIRDMQKSRTSCFR